MLSNFAGLTLNIPRQWRDITADLPSGSVSTLACESGIGVIQFSVAKYEQGTKPRVTPKDLNDLFDAFCKSHSITCIEPMILDMNNDLYVGGVSNSVQEVIAVWYLSNGLDLVLVTYTSLQPNDPLSKAELRDAIAIVKSIEMSQV